MRRALVVSLAALVLVGCSAGAGAERDTLDTCAVQLDAAAIQQVTRMGMSVRADGCLTPTEAGNVMSTLLHRDAEAQTALRQAQAGGLSGARLVQLLAALLLP